MEKPNELTKDKPHHEQIFDMLHDKDEISWQSLLQELIKSEEMDPWDIDVSKLSHSYIETVKQMQELDMKVSGKMLLAAAILLKIKSNRLVGEDIEYLDKLISQQDEEELLDFEEDESPREKEDIPADLIPRTPQPRRRKVSMQDLMQALEKALEVKRRRVLQTIPPQMEIPEKKRDISAVIKDVFGKLKAFFWDTQAKTMKFSKLTESDSKEHKLNTFLPLLHLANTQKIKLHQEKHFDDFDVILRDENLSEADLEQAREDMKQEQAE